MARCVALAAASILLLSGLAGATTRASPPLLGAMYSHFDLTGCDLGYHGITASLDGSGARRRVRAQLETMHRSGLDTLRIIVWNMHAANTQAWGVVSSAGGKLSEPARSNFIRYLADVRAAGFQRLTVAFSPQGTNNPIGEWGPSGLEHDRWDPAMLDENWQFVADVRGLAKEYGPRDTRFDLYQELPPSSFMPAFLIERLNAYIQTFWRRYAQAFGLDDASFSTIIKGADPTFAGDRLGELIAAVRSTGLPFPRWFEVHPDWSSASAYAELQQADRTLTAAGLLQPLVVGESAYENDAVAADVARFMASSSRSVDEVYEWWNHDEGSGCASPPFTADAYHRALLGTPAPQVAFKLPPMQTVTATVSQGIATVALDGRKLQAIDSGSYRIVLRDNDARHGFRLSGTDVTVSTGTRFRGRVVLPNVEIGARRPYGSTIAYSARPNGRGGVIVVH